MKQVILNNGVIMPALYSRLYDFNMYEPSWPVRHLLGQTVLPGGIDPAPPASAYPLIIVILTEKGTKRIILFEIRLRSEDRETSALGSSRARTGAFARGLRRGRV